MRPFCQITVITCHYYRIGSAGGHLTIINDFYCVNERIDNYALTEVNIGLYAKPKKVKEALFVQRF